MNDELKALLNSLATGHPIPGDRGVSILAPSADNAINAAVAEIERLRSAGAHGRQVTFWITGEPGNGKTQSLRLLEHRLSQTGGVGKYAIARIDMERESEANRDIGNAIVRKCIFGGIMVGGSEEAAEASITIAQKFNTATASTIALGIDVLLPHIGFPPGSVRTALKVLQRFSKANFITRQAIRRTIRGRWPNQRILRELTERYYNYLINPTRDEEKSFRQYLGEIGEIGKLDVFDDYCQGMRESGYTTLVVILDEVILETMKAIKSIWDGSTTKLNLVFVCAGLTKDRDMAMQAGALRRRFCESPCVHSPLSGPSVGTVGPDDFDHVVQRVSQLLETAPHLRRLDLPDWSVVRGELAGRADLTWPVLWREVIRRMMIH